MTAPVLERIRAAQGDGDHHSLREAAHSLKGAARSACCNILGDLAARLQIEAEKTIIPEKLVAEVFNEFERVRRESRALKAA